MDHFNDLLSVGIKQLVDHHTPGGIPDDTGAIRQESHPVREICLVLKGNNQFLLDGKLYPAKPGTAFIIDSWVSHGSTYPRSREGQILLWVHIGDFDIRCNFVEISPDGNWNILKKKFMLPFEFVQFVHRRLNLYLVGGDFSETALSRFLDMPIHNILDELQLQSSCGWQDFNRNKKIELVESLKYFIRINCGRQCSLKNLEKYSGFNRFYLSHLFKKHTGYSIGEYINSIKIEFVAAALNYGKSHKVIAAELGFSSPSVFCTWLKQNRSRVEYIQNYLNRNG